MSTTKTKKPVHKWSVGVFPQGQRWAKDARGRTTSAAVWGRQYTAESALNRALPNIRKMFPHAWIEITRFTLRAGCMWVAGIEDTRTINRLRPETLAELTRLAQAYVKVAPEFGVEGETVEDVVQYLQDKLFGGPHA